jgi:hypothetical protein
MLWGSRWCSPACAISAIESKRWYAMLVLAYGMDELKKVTVMLPADLLKRATAATGKGITPTIREGLEAMAASQSYEGLRRLRGRIKLSIDVDQLRAD